MSRSTTLVPVLLLLLSAAADAQPAIGNAELHPLGATPDLSAAFTELLESTEGPAWATYRVPMVAGRRALCCGGQVSCSLERRGGYLNVEDDGGEGTARHLRILLRMAGGRLTETRVFSDDCQVDAGGLPVYVWDDVATRPSLDFLLGRAAAGGKDHADELLFAVAYHHGAAVDRELERVARGERVPRLEEKAIFWLGEARGEGGFQALERLRRDLTDTDHLEHVTFALHLSEAPGALPALIEMARQHPHSDVRGQALFWLSQEAGERAADAIADAAEDDPDLDVKERAVFALSQLPPDRGVPLLIRYAETHASPEVRKKAMFWLGQSEDPRALELFERILSR